MRNLTLYRNSPVVWFDNFFEVPNYLSEKPKGFHWEVEETEGHYLMRFDLPGVKKNDLKIEVKNDVLTVSGERKDIRKKENYGAYGSFEQAFTLPEGVDTDKIEANLEDGVLQLAVPKLAEKQPKQIKIGVGERTGLFSKLLGSKDRDEVVA